MPATSASSWPRTRATSRRSTRSSKASRARSRPTAPRAPGDHDSAIALPILIHGDASFPGQGVVAETLNLQRLDRLYTNGGTLHVIANDEIGFTTDPRTGARRAMARRREGLDNPIIVVKADDPEAAISAIRVALACCRGFGSDVVVAPGGGAAIASTGATRPLTRR